MTAAQASLVTPENLKIEPYFSMPYNKFLAIREEFFAICDDLIEALILRVVEYAIEKQRKAWHIWAEQRKKLGLKVPKEPKTWWISLSRPQIIKALYGIVKDKRTIIAKVGDLLEKKFLRYRKDPQKPYGSLQYTIDRRRVQKLLDALPPRISPSPLLEDDEEITEDENLNNDDAARENNVEREGVQEMHPPSASDAPPQYNRWTGGGASDAPHKESKKSNRESVNKKDSAAAARLLSFPLLSSKIDLESLRSSAWTPETLLCLSSSILEVPDIEAVEASGDPAAIEILYQDWLRPAQKLYDATLEFPAVRAWERIDLTERYMATPGSPSWWQRPADQGGRKTKSPVTLKNVMDRLTIEYAVFDAHRNEWYPERLTQYFGPPLIEEEPAPYAQGYTGVTSTESVTSVMVTEITEEAEMAMMLPPLTRELAQSSEEDAERIEEAVDGAEGTEIEVQGPITEEVPMVSVESVQPRKQRGMDVATAENLEAWLLEDYPHLIIPGFRQVAPDLWAVVVSLGPDQHIDVRRSEQWYQPSEKMLQRIEQALLYGAQCNAMIRNESSEVDAAQEAQMSMEGG